MSKYDDYPKSLRKNKYKFIICMLAISVVSFAVFYVYVNINSILLAFKEFVGYGDDGKSVYTWSLGNFRKLFAELSGGESSTSLLLALRNTLLLFSAATRWRSRWVVSSATTYGRKSAATSFSERFSISRPCSRPS